MPCTHLARGVAALVGAHLDRASRCAAREACAAFDAIHWANPQHGMRWRSGPGGMPLSPSFPERLAAVRVLKPHMRELQVRPDLLQLAGFDNMARQNAATRLWRDLAYAADVECNRVTLLLDTESASEARRAAELLQAQPDELSSRLLAALRVQAVLRCCCGDAGAEALTQLGAALGSLPNGCLEFVLVRDARQDGVDALDEGGAILAAQRTVLAMPHAAVGELRLRAARAAVPAHAQRRLEVAVPATALPVLAMVVPGAPPRLALHGVSHVYVCCDTPLDADSRTAAQGLAALIAAAPDLLEFELEAIRSPFLGPPEDSAMWRALIEGVVRHAVTVTATREHAATGATEPGAAQHGTILDDVKPPPPRSLRIVLSSHFVRGPAWLAAIARLLFATPTCHVAIVLERRVDAFHLELARNLLVRAGVPGVASRITAAPKRGSSETAQAIVDRDSARAAAIAASGGLMALVAQVEPIWQPTWGVLLRGSASTAA